MQKLNSSNEWGRLKEIIVGKIPNNYLIPTTKKTPFTSSDISLIKHCSAKVFPAQMIKKSQAELENLCSILKKFGSKVLRPSDDHVGKIFSTPFYHSVGEIVYNARDLVLIIGDKIIECPSQERYRLFETYGYQKIFHK